MSESVYIDCISTLLMQVFIKTLTGRSFVLGVYPEDTVQDVYRKVEEREGIPAKLQRLIFAGRSLQPQHTLAYYSVMKESTLHMVLRLPGGQGFQVIVKTLTGMVYMVGVESEDTTLMVKEKLTERCGMAAENLRMIHRGRGMEDGRTLADYNVGHLSELHLVFRYRQPDRDRN